MRNLWVVAALLAALACGDSGPVARTLALESIDYRLVTCPAGDPVMVTTGVTVGVFTLVLDGDLFSAAGSALVDLEIHGADSVWVEQVVAMDGEVSGTVAHAADGSMRLVIARGWMVNDWFLGDLLWQFEGQDFVGRVAYACQAEGGQALTIQVTFASEKNQ